MKCGHCTHIIKSKPWVIYKNEDETVTNLCSYLCSRHYPNVTTYNYKNVMNPEDFDEYRLSPIIHRQEDMKLLTLGEVSKLNDSQRDEYQNHLERMFSVNEVNEKLYNEHIEIEMSYRVEDELQLSNTLDDY